MFKKGFDPDEIVNVKKETLVKLLRAVFYLFVGSGVVFMGIILSVCIFLQDEPRTISSKIMLCGVLALLLLIWGGIVWILNILQPYLNKKEKILSSQELRELADS